MHRENIAETEPVWSPDGRWVAFLSLRLGGGDPPGPIRLSLSRVRASGGKLKRIGTLPAPRLDESEWERPSLTWLPRPR